MIPEVTINGLTKSEILFEIDHCDAMLAVATADFLALDTQRARLRVLLKVLRAGVFATLDEKEREYWNKLGNPMPTVDYRNLPTETTYALFKAPK